MTLLSLQKAIGVPTAGSMRLSENRPYAVQLVIRTSRMFWVTKGVILRNVPITADRPTPRLAEWRYRFAVEGAPRWRGATGVGTLKYDSASGKHKAGDMVLAVQAKAQEVLKELAKGLTNPRTDTWNPEKGRYDSYKKYARNSVEQLKRFARL